MRPVALAGILASTTILTGCAGTIAGVSLSSFSQFAGIASTLFTGADLGEHAASLVTGKDCRFSEGLMRADRDVCEEPGSAATRADFHGIFIDRIEEDGTVIYAAPKYMSASVGAGENENDPDQIWAEIKSQKAKEAAERELARRDAAQIIDVASLSSGSLSTQTLAYMPAGAVSARDIGDSDTASQTAARERPVVNAAKPAPKQDVKQAAPVTPSDEPAIDEAALTATLKAARENGQGGPLLTTSPSSAPVVSKLINGEPVVILRLGPIFGGVAPTADTATAEPVEFAAADPEPTVSRPAAAPAPAAPVRPAAALVRSTAASGAPSPLAILNNASRQQKPQEVRMATAADPTAAAAPATRPRTKPATTELTSTRPAPTGTEKAFVETISQKGNVLTADPDAAALTAKPAKPAKARKADASEEAYQPPSDFEDASASAPVQTPSDIPASDSVAATAPTYVPPLAGSDAPPAATTSPAPLFPISQP